jgi:hypothetical protein
MATYGYTPLGKSVSLSVSGGAGYYQAESIQSQISPIGSVTFAAGLTRTTRFTAAYGRRFSQSLGFGRTLLIDFASLSLSQSIGTKVDLTLRAGGTFGQDPLIEGSGYDAVRFGGTVSWHVLESLNVGTSVVELRREQDIAGGISESSRRLWTVFITYTAHWR